MKPLYSKRIRKEYKLYVLGVVIILLAVAVAILAWAGGNLRTVFIFGAVAVVISMSDPSTYSVDEWFGYY